MGYKALYRVWRPRTFADVVGQEHITRTLQNAISTSKFSHAYLFSGPRGTGKTSAAKIFAQTINCEQMPTIEPCNECDACQGILNGSIPDVIEIDAASNTSVDDIRDIRDQVKYAPSVVPYKVYIIDEVHMISVNAFNALLKTLEEPPPHVVFILATTEPHKIPLTIISRCQRFDFKPISNQVIVERMHHIMEQENHDVSSEALEAIALTAEGGMRDALSILDQVISYSEDIIEIDDVLAVTGGVSQQILTEIAAAMYAEETKTVIHLFDSLIQSGKDPGRFVFDLIYFMRDLLFYKTTEELAAHLERAIVTDSFKELAEKVDVNWIQAAIMELTECEQQLRWTTSPKIFVEVTLITITSRHFESDDQEQSLANSGEIVQLQQRVIDLEKAIEKLKQAPQQVTRNQVAPNRERARSSSRRNLYDAPIEKIRNVLGEAEKVALNQVQEHWPTFLTQLKNMNAPAHATIQDSRPVASSKDSVIVAFKYEIHCSLFLEHKEVVQSLLANNLAQRNIIPIPEQDWEALRSEYIAQHGKEKKEESSDKLVDEAVKLFGEDIVEVRE